MSAEAGAADVLPVPPDAACTACEAEIPATHYRLMTRAIPVDFTGPHDLWILRRSVTAKKSGGKIRGNIRTVLSKYLV